MKKILLQAVIVVVSVAVLAEIFLRLTGKYLVYSEINGGAYYTEYGTIKPSWYHTRTPNDTFIPPSPDFHYPYITNSLGIREKEYSQTKSDSTIRILVTGDSFAEGVGTPYDSTWPRLLEKQLIAKGLKVEVIDAGVAGSDIFYAYVFYRDKLKNYHPDIVIASFNASDYVDYLVRGGMERFKADGTIHFKSPPWYEPLYKHSRFFRAILHKVFGFWVNGLYVSSREYQQESPHITESFAKAFSDYDLEAAKNGATFVALLHNMPGEISAPDNVIFKSNNANTALLDKLLKEQHITSFNLSHPLSEKFSSQPPQSFSHLHDFHFNSKGYAYMAELACDSLLTLTRFKR
jgi:lysophospholipase L1-like esterase